MIDILKALSDENRLRIVNLLLNDGELCVCDIEGVLNITQSNASRHLTRLKTSGIINHEKKAQWVFYKIDPDFMQENQMLIEYLKEKIFITEKYVEDTKKLIDYEVTIKCVK